MTASPALDPALNLGIRLTLAGHHRRVLHFSFAGTTIESLPTLIRWRGIMRRKLLLAVVGSAAVTTPVLAQPQPAPAFEVTSVKANKSPDMRGMRMQFLPGGRFSAANVPLRFLLVTAYNLPFQSMRLSEGPDWINFEKFDIEAKAGDGVIPAGLSDKDRNEKMRLMLQSLLADRFKLAIRRETKEQTLY